jgi:predicted GH43/DUF377 family glycosyl hydrolase
MAAQTAADQPRWVIGPWTRESTEPVIHPDPSQLYKDPVSGATVHWEALHTFNPAAVVHDGRVYVLYRAEGDSGVMAVGGHTSRLGLAVSDDGVHFRQEPQPVFGLAKDAQFDHEDDGGTEDPRIVEAPDGTYVLTYTQWAHKRNVYTIGLATSPDLRTWTKLGPIFPEAATGPYHRYKSSGIVTEMQHGRLIAAKVKGKFWMYWGEIEVHLASSPDLLHWTPVESAPGQPLTLLAQRPGLPDSGFPETGAPAVVTPRGILLLYNAKNGLGDGADKKIGLGAYSVEEALFDAGDPSKLIGRTGDPVFEPQLPFERTGQYTSGTTFAEGLVWFKGKWWMYYGCADSFVGVASAPGEH